MLVSWGVRRAALPGNLRLSSISIPSHVTRRALARVTGRRRFELRPTGRFLASLPSLRTFHLNFPSVFSYLINGSGQAES